MNIAFQLHCTYCGTNLVGVDLQGTCPTCFRRVGMTIDLDRIDPTTMTVSHFVSCVGCGYGVRNFSVGSDCPSCGTPIVQTLRDPLGFADARWRWEVKRGLTLLRAAAIAPLVLAAIPMLAFAIGLLFGLDPTDLTPSPAFSSAVSFVVVLGLYVLFLRSIFAITSPEPHRRDVAAQTRCRRARVLGLVSAACAVPSLFLTEVASAWSEACCVVSAALALTVGVAALRNLSRRADRPALRVATTAFIWLLRVFCATAAAKAIVTTIEAARGTGPDGTGVSTVSSVWFGLLLACWLGTLLIVQKYHELLVDFERGATSDRPQARNVAGTGSVLGSAFVVWIVTSVVVDWAYEVWLGIDDVPPAVALGIPTLVAIANALSSGRYFRARHERMQAGDQAARAAMIASGVCPTCEYDLTGNTSGICPECGEKLNGGMRRGAGNIETGR